MVAYTCRYSRGPLIPNSATATDWNNRINCPLEYISAGVGYPCFLTFYIYVTGFMETDPNHTLEVTR